MYIAKEDSWSSCSQQGINGSPIFGEGYMPIEDRYLRWPAEANQPFFEWNGENRAELDYSRIMRSAEFYRLATVTQVVTPDDNPRNRTRLTHTLDVCRIGQILTNYFNRTAQKDGSIEDLQSQLDEYVIAAACLAHDIGHPPYGHIAEILLDALMRVNVKGGIRNTDGFEGNAQSFRIVTKLAIPESYFKGLGLCRATLCAILKYPNLRDSSLIGGESGRVPKFGAYRSEEKEFLFARVGRIGVVETQPSLEAQIMNFADDIAYSIFDVIDFHRYLPLDQLLFNQDERLRFLNRWKTQGSKVPPDWMDSNAVKELAQKWTMEGEWMSHDARVQEKIRIAATIRDYVKSASLVKDGYYWNLHRDPYKDGEIDFMKRLVFDYLICSPRLITIQKGQKVAVETLFNYFFESSINGAKDNLPIRYQEEIANTKDNIHNSSRLAADIICGLGDREAHEMYGRLSGFMVPKISEDYDW
jgi:dGTPase